jgi:tetratricopeptide (TPR) repeat protein
VHLDGPRLSDPYHRLVDSRDALSHLAFAEEAVTGLRGLEADAVLGQLEARYPELLAAVEWFLDQGRNDQALRLVSALTTFWMATKRLEEGSVWFDWTLETPGGDDSQRGRALFDAGYLAFWQGDDERSSAFHNQALELGRQIGDPTLIAIALSGLARIALRTDVEEARRLCREALAVTEGTDDRLGRGHATHVLGVAAQMSGDFLEARGYMTERIEQAREAGNLATVSSEAGNLSMVERQLGNLERAEALAREALDIDYRRGNGLAMPWKINGLAAVAADRGEFQRAATLIGMADAMMEAAGGAWPPDEWIHYERTVDTATKAMGSVAFDRARAQGRVLDLREAIDFALGTQPTR